MVYHFLFIALFSEGTDYRCMHECVKELQRAQCNCSWYYDWQPGSNVPVCEPAVIRRCLVPTATTFRDSES